MAGRLPTGEPALQLPLIVVHYAGQVVAVHPPVVRCRLPHEIIRHSASLFELRRIGVLLPAKQIEHGGDPPQAGRVEASYCAANSAVGGIGLITSMSTPFGSLVMKCRWPKGSSRKGTRIGSPASWTSR
ncbi:hypothetical protein Mnod_0983 [Methylobacterium nodulans ORS 2060]|uniref:Uncharacterized protein n=1 Tax=Methylobacterium nodulans (strain LMG 21967 / CNCM I-2342 / ORS 2060) TaxID=460265 RepID=B8IHV8_METNO|nr:hypothetical protein Mnod_0983 [Methylobacterium nodulans ORS 2060]